MSIFFVELLGKYDEFLDLRYYLWWEKQFVCLTDGVN